MHFTVLKCDFYYRFIVEHSWMSSLIKKKKRLNSLRARSDLPSAMGLVSVQGERACVCVCVCALKDKINLEKCLIPCLDKYWSIFPFLPPSSIKQAYILFFPLCSFFFPMKAITSPSSAGREPLSQHPSTFCSFLHCPKVKYKPFTAGATIILVKPLGITIIQEENDQRWPQYHIRQRPALPRSLLDNTLAACRLNKSSVHNNWCDDFSGGKTPNKGYNF